MNFIGQALQDHKDNIFARDDYNHVASYNDAQDAVTHWQNKLGSDKQFIFLLCENTTNCLLLYAALTANNHAVLLLDNKVSNDTLQDFQDRYIPDLIITSEDGQTRIIHQEKPSGGLYPDLSLMLSTSGSTGSPKIVRFIESHLAANALSIADYLKIDASERPLTHLPIHYSYGMSIVNSHIVVGATLELTKRSMMEGDFWKRFESAGITSFSGVPFHYDMLKKLRFERKNMPALKTLTQAGGKLAEAEVRHFAALSEKYDWDFYVMYGQTEAGPRISYLPHQDVDAYAHTIGKPIPGVQLDIIEDDGSLVSGIGKEGELIVTSPSIMLGYAISREDLALGDSCYGKLKTGDLAVRQDNGYFQITGRIKRFIKLQGNRVSLDDVEQRMTAIGHPMICVGEDDVLYMILEDKVEEEQVKADALRLFTFPPRSMVIKSGIIIPRSSSGKVQYKQLLTHVKELQNAN